MKIKPRTEKPTLSQFADYLADLHERQKRWIIRAFYFSEWKAKWFVEGRKSCKTHACAIGWGLIEKQLPGMVFDDYGGPEYEGATRSDAIAKYFEIDHKKAIDLFVNQGFYNKRAENVTALDVSNAIKKFLKERD